MGTQVYFVDSAAYQSPVKIHWITNEETPWNNLNDQFAVVRSSYDPNFKEVAPKGKDTDGKIELTEKEFRYVVHFENNGTAPAQKVVLVDTLDSDLDISTFRLLNNSSLLATFTFFFIPKSYTIGSKELFG